LKKIERVSPSDHVLLFYDDEAELRQSAGAYLTDALLGGSVAVVIASAAHRAMFEHELTEVGLDLDKLTDSGSWVVLDATETLGQLLHAGRVDPEAFESVVGQLIGRTAERGRPVCAYGEMVALLWENSQVNAAVELEELWNSLGERTPFSLFCSYSAASLSDPSLAHEIEIVCSQHSHVVESPEPLPSRTTHRAVQAFAATSEAITEARHFAADITADWDHSLVSDDVQLIVSELASNAVRHAHSEFIVVMSDTDASIRIAVFDTSHEVAILQHPENSSSSGRGLMLVTALSSTWGVEQTDDGKVVWAQLQL
jgi:anti-sigma regulatory factor (Ser/Thr protein kinase)